MANMQDHGEEDFRDYLEQISWQQRFGRYHRLPSRSDGQEPKWRYKIVRPKSAKSGTDENTVWIMALGGLGVLIAAGFAATYDHSGILPGMIAIGIAVILVVVLAARDSENIPAAECDEAEREPEEDKAG